MACGCLASPATHPNTNRYPVPRTRAAEEDAISARHGTTLTLTGERTLPGIEPENYWFRRHEAAYRFVLPACGVRTVLDAGCGEGYGADLLAGFAGRVVALDYDAATVAHVAATYPRLSAVRGNLAVLPLAAGQVDAVACLQVIEHLWDQPGFLRECARVLRPGGLLALSTPNRLTFSPDGAPENPFHARELSAAELAGLLDGAGFEVTAMLGVRHGPKLRRLDRRHGGSVVAAQLAAPPERWDDRLRHDVAGVHHRDFTVRPTDVDTSLDLLATARPRGAGTGRSAT